jgi:dipeptidyl aminopeptidase/acylaminoacyl peptidase
MRNHKTYLLFWLSLFIFAMGLSKTMTSAQQSPILDTSIIHIAWHPNGTTAAVASFDWNESEFFTQNSRLALFNTATNSEQILHYNPNDFSHLISNQEWSLNGETIFISIYKEVRIYNSSTGNLISTLPQPQPIDTFSISPSGDKIAVTLWGGTIRIQDIATTSLLAEFSFNDDITLGNLSLAHQMTWVGWSPDGTQLATVGRDRKIRIWHPQTLTIIQEFEFPRGSESDIGLTSAAWSPDGSKIAIGGFYGLWIWSPITRQILQTIYQNTFISIRDVQWHPFSNQFAIVVGSIIFFDGDTGSRVGTPIRDTRGTISSFDWSYTGEILYGISVTNNEGVNLSSLIQMVQASPPLPVAPIVPNLVISSAPTTTRTNVAITPAPAVQLVDAAGAPLAQPGVPVTVALNAADANPVGTVSGTLTQLTDAAGVATFTDLSIDAPGLKTLTFAAPDMPALTSEPFLVYTPGTIDITHTDAAAGLTDERATIGDSFSQRHRVDGG